MVYAYIFVEPETGKSEYLLLPTVNILWMQAKLKTLRLELIQKEAHRFGLDQAGWHMSKSWRYQSNILLMPLWHIHHRLSPPGADG
jgi:hypothetical protein